MEKLVIQIMQTFNTNKSLQTFLKNDQPHEIHISCEICTSGTALAHSWPLADPNGPVITQWYLQGLAHQP